MDNLEELRSAYREWDESRGADPCVWLDLMADDVVLRSIADGSAGMEFSAPRQGIAEAAQYFAELTRAWEMLYFVVDDLFSAGDRAVMVGRCAWRYRATGKEVASPTAHIWRFRDEKIVSFEEFYDTARALAATVRD